MTAGFLLIATSLYLNIYYAVAGILLVQGALGFIVVPCSEDALSAFENRRATASALFGFVQSVVGGLSVAVAGGVGASNVGVSAALTIISLCLIIVITIATGRKKGAAP